MAARRAMWISATLASALAVTAGGGAPAHAQEVGPGAYACQGARAVSIRHEDDGTPVAGAEAPPEMPFRILIGRADPEDQFMNCMAIAGADDDTIQDLCRDGDLVIYEAAIADRDEPWFAALYAWAGRIEAGAPVTFMNGPSSLHFFAGRGDFRYTLIYSVPQSVPMGFTFDYVTEQGSCRRTG
ncbi:hypothetical protein [Acuticoccus sp. I52.16.1]|uniref:hypothetical protein n=1 Tax=Acuticoccus sp. I52.16.1 TaxID=2928472 RepID=UPI001FD56541|nr:hypothetical protein [Acuticoccus sp. I52.16.1]UOM34069.1 hypothetical protein MRB58_19905 [Acuticoccus sp. I52.16.1]